MRTIRIRARDRKTSPASSVAGMLVAVAVVAAVSIPVALAQDGGAVPRTPDGRPDLQGNWTNGTITPIERPQGFEAVLTPEQVAQIEGGRQECIEAHSGSSDPDRDAPAEGGIAIGCDFILEAAAGGTGGYNLFYLDRGDQVAVVNGEPRSSLLMVPEDGRIPARTAEAQQRLGQLMAARGRHGEYDNPENRPLSERCVVSFGSNAGPPMLPNYFYNNNYTIVQTPDHVAIMTEMVHDTRIIPIGVAPGAGEADVTGAPPSFPDAIRPWFGDSRGWWEDDTLVIETSKLNPQQLTAYREFFGASPNMKITERLTRVDANTINYEFLIDDPDTWETPWGGEVPFVRMDDLLYEYACHEANYALENVLRGARAQERENR
ncbi:MAG: hypothetical protein F4Y74_01610 [Gemmatimonadales bacterium]|nr:hypothetical protein [Gemmatimonadales bacterium]MYG20586.1 hypothetical protein [Gemmatimonadales bacterium]MYH09573.1 hypothetical protein [Gemmatimonadales bacterium]MYL05637.1 hypothetical protein [Gemmatimonadales bacterium]